MNGDKYHSGVPTDHRAKAQPPVRVGRFWIVEGRVLPVVAGAEGSGDAGGGTATLPAPTNDMIEFLRSQRGASQKALDDYLAERRTAGGDLTDEHKYLIDVRMAEIREQDKRIDEMVDTEKRRLEAAEAARGGGGGGGARINREPHTYGPEVEAYRSGSGYSWFLDLFRSSKGDRESSERLQRHAKECEVDLAERRTRRESGATAELRNTFGGEATFERRVNPNRLDGQGGYFVPPLWLVDEYIEYLRFGRVFVNSVKQLDLPEGTDSINIPKLSLGTAVGMQTDAGGVESQDYQDTAVSAGVRTIAGQEDVALQLLEQSPGQIVDRMLMMDLTDAYNQQCDIQSLLGTGVGGLNGGQVQGIATLAGTNGVTFTNASPNPYQLWTPFTQAASQLAKNRKKGLTPQNTKFFMHPQRWWWMVGGLDSSNRPLVVPNGFGPFNPLAENADPAAEGYMGNLALGFGVWADGNITTTASGSTVSGGNQDQIYLVKTDDVFWFEGALRTRVLGEVLSGTLQVRFQAYNYVAQLTRYAQAISVISGTGLASPSGY